MKVLQIVEPGKDGVFRHVEYLSDYALSRGVEIALAYSDRRAADLLMPFVRRVEAAGGATMNLGVSNHPRPGDLRALLRLRRFCAAVEPDVIHAHSSKAGALGRALRLLGVRAPVFYTPHAYFSMSQDASQVWVFRWAERLLGRIGITVHVSSDEEAYGRTVLGLKPARQRTIDNPVDTLRFHPATPEARLQLRREFGMPADAVVIGTVARFSPQKDPIIQYRALAPVLLAHRNLWVAHVGDGDLLPECRRLWREMGIADRVISIPYLADCSDFYRTLDAFILTSQYEGQSLAVLEALATDLPLILSLAPGNRQFLEAGLSHLWTATVGDVPSFCRALGSWWLDRSSVRPSNHRATAERRFNHDVCFGRLLQEYARAAGSGAGRPSLRRTVRRSDHQSLPL